MQTLWYVFLNTQCYYSCIVLTVKLLTPLSVPVTAQFEAMALIAEVVGSNSAKCLDVCPRLYVLRCPMEVEALRLADHSYKKSYQMSENFETGTEPNTKTDPPPKETPMSSK